MEHPELIPHLFRTEYTKIVSVLCKTFGLTNIELAEDVTSDTFLKASETWGMKGIPENPTAWLYTVAKNKAKDHFKRASIYQDKISPELSRLTDYSVKIEIDLSDSNIKDSQLRMLFAVCNPSTSNESQITLALRYLCGFGIDEIASALLTNKQTINKRLYRAKDKFNKEDLDFSLLSEMEMKSRLANVLSIIYLLFNEGYYAHSSSQIIRKDLCMEAMRLLFMLTENSKTSLPEVNALMALFCFQTSRFEARMDQEGKHILYEDQDKSKWNIELIEKGEFFLSKSAKGTSASKYHLEALIAFWHSQKKVDEKKKWEDILHLYNQLLQIEYSPVAALNRTYALAKARNKQIALKEALKINLKEHHLYHSLLAELYTPINPSKQLEHLKLALQLAPNPNDKQVIHDKINKLII